MNIAFRPATIDDAPFVATVMMEAVEIPMMEEKRTPEPHLIDICRRTDTLYSYKNAIIIEDGERPIAGLISYEGAGYHEVKMRTFGMVKDKLPFDFETMDDETREGEYYLDSLAVLPEYRGRGIGRRAIEHGVSIARERGLLPILACDPDNTNAYNLYKKIGFHEDGKLFIFGETYLRMVFD
ncbi:MAG: GNAT family N-acetyltransferase [Bacteroidaceae bacterium]|nr:GNAT family N-acetyltransferase [Bacteroidaceae bacterium]